MKVPKGDGDNVRIWKLEQRGSFSLRSAYRLATTRRGNLSNISVEGDWQLIWKAQLPQKIKQLLWRLARGVVATRENLRRRGMEVHDSCGVCSADGESTTHVLLECELARDCWTTDGLWEWINKL
ncbi:Putative ribonuclease H protein At1g65750 [Linum perenne]